MLVTPGHLTTAVAGAMGATPGVSSALRTGRAASRRGELKSKYFVDANIRLILPQDFLISRMRLAMVTIFGQEGGTVYGSRVPEYRLFSYYRVLRRLR